MPTVVKASVTPPAMGTGEEINIIHRNSNKMIFIPRFMTLTTSLNVNFVFICPQTWKS